MNEIVIVADSREQAPYSFEQWPVNVVRAGLPAGDYSLIGFEDRVAVERKTLDDLIGCLMGKERDRFQRELSKLRPYESAAVIIEATLCDITRGRYRSQMKPQAALQSIATFFVRCGVPFLFCGDRASGEYMTYSLLSKYLYEIDKRYRVAQKAMERAIVKRG